MDEPLLDDVSIGQPWSLRRWALAICAGIIIVAAVGLWPGALLLGSLDAACALLFHGYRIAFAATLLAGLMRWRGRGRPAKAIAAGGVVLGTSATLAVLLLLLFLYRFPDAYIYDGVTHHPETLAYMQSHLGPPFIERAALACLSAICSAAVFLWAARASTGSGR
jgi:hypothetical protein